MFVFAVIAQLLVAEGSIIYIREDGSITPLAAPIKHENGVYILTEDITCEGFVVQRDNIVIDGYGHILKGTEDGQAIVGIHLNSVSNVTLSNFRIQGFRWGLQISYGTSNKIIGCAISDCYCGIFIFQSSNNTLKNNSLAECKYGFDIHSPSSSPEHFIHDIDDSNTINGRPVYYFINKHGLEIPPGAGWIALVNCTYITVRNQALTNNTKGILLVYTENSTIVGNRFVNNREAICLIQSSNNSITRNLILDSVYGIFLGGSQNAIYENNIEGSHRETEEGIGTGIFISGYLNYIYKNNLTGNEIGITLADKATSNVIFENNILENEIGICVLAVPFGKGAQNNTIYHNNFINNTRQVYQHSGFAIPISINMWDNGREGNYWSDYNGIDNNGDGIGDTPYIIDENNRDNYPLIKPWPEGLKSGEFFSMALTWVVAFTILTAVTLIFIVYLKIRTKRRRLTTSIPRTTPLKH